MMEHENMELIEEVNFVEQDADALADEMEIAVDTISQKCREIKALWKQTASRIADDWKETNGNPYIRQTFTRKVEIFRKAGDETPIDSFQMTDVKSYSFRALAIATGIAATLFCVTGSLMKKH
jgi:hypothetical protein